MNSKELAQLKARIVRACRVHFYLVLAIGVQTMIYDAWKLVVPEGVLQRWLIAAVIFVGSTVVWLLARSPSKKLSFYQYLIASLVIIDVLAVSYFVYLTRGMASLAVMLYVIPIILVSALRSRVPLIATSFFAVAAYLLTSVAYFVFNFNEGFKIQLYGEVGFYSAVIVLVAYMLWAVVNPSKKD